MGKVWPWIASAAVITAGAGVATGLSRDGRGAMNVDIAGEYQMGECAKLLALPETKNPVTQWQLLENIKQIGRMCGYCYDGNTIGFQGVAYDICIDPDTMEFNYSSGSQSTLGVTGYMELYSELSEAPEGYLYAAMDANPGVCAAAIVELGIDMKNYFNQAFGEQVAMTLIPDVHIAEESNHPCEAVSVPQSPTAP